MYDSTYNKLFLSNGAKIIQNIKTNVKETVKRTYQFGAYKAKHIDLLNFNF